MLFGGCGLLALELGDVGKNGLVLVIGELSCVDLQRDRSIVDQAAITRSGAIRDRSSGGRKRR